MRIPVELVVLLLLYVALVLWWRADGSARDRLTGLSTRVQFTEVITRCATQAVWRRDYRYAVLVLEIDSDRALRRAVGRFGVEDAIADTAERLALLTRGTDVVARIAERRFGVLLDEVADAEGARTAARRLVTALDEASTLSGRRVRTTPIAGLALSGDGALQPDELLARAEASLRVTRSPAGDESGERGVLIREADAL
jgi:GGDEF domain-containing protein